MRIGALSHNMVCVLILCLPQLLDLFPEEGGQKGKKHPRLIPYLPGKNYQRFLKSRETAEKRLPELHRYSRYDHSTHQCEHNHWLLSLMLMGDLSSCMGFLWTALSIHIVPYPALTNPALQVRLSVYGVHCVHMCSE